MNEEMKSAFRRLDINDKRNQLSNELLIMYELIKKLEIVKAYFSRSMFMMLMDLFVQ